MHKHNSHLAIMLLAVLAATMIVSCDNDDDIINPVTIDPAVVEALLIQGLDNISGVGELLQRLLLHLGGTPQPGINIVPNATGGTGTVGLDLDGDGFQESTVAGSYTLNDPAAGIAAGAVIQITEVAGRAVQITAALTLSGPTQATFSDIVANVPAEGTSPQVTVSDGELIVDASTSPPTLSGFADFAVGGVPATITLTNPGGVPTIVVMGPGFTITVP